MICVWFIFFFGVSFLALIIIMIEDELSRKEDLDVIPTHDDSIT